MGGLVSEEEYQFNLILKFLVKNTKKDQHCGNSIGRAKVCIE